MKYIKLTSRSSIATWLTTSFMLSLLFVLAFSEFFQNTTQSKNTLDLLSKPIRADIIANIKTIKIKNRMGHFVLNHQNNQWILKEPRVMPAKLDTLNKIIESLKDVHVNTIHQLEPINIQNFSLDRPIMSIDLYSKLEESLHINVGLVNPINNTSYLTVSGHNNIYQIEVLKNSIELMELSDFIESSIFSTNIADVSEFHLYQRGQKESINSVTRKDNEWISKKYKSVTKESIESKLQKMFDIKTHMIVDKQDDKLQTFISNYLENPLYTIKIVTKNQKNITYQISPLIKSLPELKLEKKQYFIMTASDRLYPYIIDKDYLEEFVIRYKDFK